MIRWNESIQQILTWMMMINFLQGLSEMKNEFLKDYTSYVRSVPR